MPRRLLRDRRIVVDEWRYVSEAVDDTAAPIIVTLSQWQLEPDTWLARGSRLGVVLSPAHQVEQIAADLGHFALIAALGAPERVTIEPPTHEAITPECPHVTVR